MVTQHFVERAVVFPCKGSDLIGIVTIPEVPCSTALVIVVGGSQYRVGSHRQFTLLARRAGEAGVASIRFDYRGMGDSEGTMAPGVDGIEDDIRAAIDAVIRAVPTVKAVALWGLCGAASGSALYAPTDSRVTGVAMLNPWVRTQTGLAKAQIRHYYLGRFRDWEFWRRLLRGEVRVLGSLRSLVPTLLAVGREAFRPASRERANEFGRSIDVRMAESLLTFEGQVLLILSGKDLTADEFRDAESANPRLRKTLQSERVTRFGLKDANHTFARTDWRAQIEQWTIDWVLRRPQYSGSGEEVVEPLG